MADKLLIDQKDNGVLLLTLNRPKQLNAIDRELEDLVVAALAKAETDESIGAVVLAGNGERAFCAGYDVKDMFAQGEDEFRVDQLRKYRNWWRIAAFEKPLVTANHAMTLGWGAITSVSADIRIGCENTVFQFTAVPHGGANLTWNLPQLVGWSKAKEYLMLGKRIPPQEAERSGLLNRIVAPEDVLSEALEDAALMASYPPHGVKTIKKLIRDAMGREQQAAINAEEQFGQHAIEDIGNPVQLHYQDFIAERSKK